jgi:hypothetical protein
LEELLLRVNGRLVRVLIDDARGANGCVPTLICREARAAEVVAHAEPESSGPGRFPSFPLALRGELTADAVGPAELKLDVSELPGGLVAFALEDFCQQVAREVESGTPGVRLDVETAAAWGCRVAAT